MVVIIGSPQVLTSCPSEANLAEGTVNIPEVGRLIVIDSDHHLARVAEIFFAAYIHLLFLFSRAPSWAKRKKIRSPSSRP